MNPYDLSPEQWLRWLAEAPPRPIGAFRGPRVREYRVPLRERLKRLWEETYANLWRLL